MKVILFDSVVDGHHVGYVSYVTQYLVKQGNKVTFVGGQPDESVERLREEGAEDVRRVQTSCAVTDANSRAEETMQKRSLIHIVMLQEATYEGVQ